MKNKLFKRLLVCSLTALLLLPMLLSLPLQAAALEQPEQNAQYVQWTLSEDGSTLSNGQTTYTRYNRDHSNFGLLSVDPQTKYRYANKIIHPDDLNFRNKQACLTLDGQAEPNLRMWFHFYVVLGDEAVFPIELCLVPVLITFLIQNLKRIQTRRENSHFLFTLGWEAMRVIMAPFGFVCKRCSFGV